MVKGITQQILSSPHYRFIFEEIIIYIKPFLDSRLTVTLLFCR